MDTTSSYQLTWNFMALVLRGLNMKTDALCCHCNYTITLLTPDVGESNHSLCFVLHKVSSHASRLSPPGQHEIQHQTPSHDEEVKLDDITDDNAIERKSGKTLC
jgi:hypothetical protein